MSMSMMMMAVNECWCISFDVHAVLQRKGINDDRKWCRRSVRVWKITRRYGTCA
jgi:hypothetical protein